MRQSIEGKVALVTGASSGIGRAAARALSEEGARLALSARSRDRLEALNTELGGGHLVVPVDLTKPSDVEAMVSATTEYFGHVDILFANAGIYVPGDLVDGDPDDFDELIEVNVKSTVRAVRAVLPLMIARKTGDIVVTSSVSGHQAIQWEPVYSASKHAVQSLVHGVRRQVSKHNIRVCSLAPGMVLNELWGITDPAEIERKVAERSGLRVEDVADALLFILTRPANVTVRDLVILPQDQDI